MPKYEYACKSCGEHIEVVQSFKDESLTECPSCGGPLRKVFGSIGVVLKGSGFYRNDSRTSSGSLSKRPDSGETAGAKSGEGEGSGAKDPKSKAADAKTGSGEGSKTPPSSSSSGSTVAKTA